MLGPARVTVALDRWLHGMVGALFPAKCLGCGRLFHYDATLSSKKNAPLEDRTSAFSRAMALHLCPHCRVQWTAVASPMCSRCGMVFNSRVGADHLCGRCLDRPAAFSRARAVGIYDKSLRIVIHALKFKGQVGLAGPAASLEDRPHRCGGTSAASPAAYAPTGLQPGLPADERMAAAR